MPYRLVSKGRASGDDLIVVYAIILGVFFFFCILPMIEKKHLREVEKMTNTKNALKMIMHDKIDTNICSKQCCKHTQWPLPKEIQHKGDLTPEQMKNLGIGISTSVGIGGDPINGSSFRDIIEKFETDDETDAILMIGEIGGPQEVAAGEFAKENMKKPVIGYIAGLTAPKGRVMGHAGAIVSAYGESAIEKVEILKDFGVTISKNPSVMGETVKSVLEKNA